MLRINRHEPIEYQGKAHLPVTFTRDFVCAECGGRIHLCAEGLFEVLFCYEDARHDGFIPYRTWQARLAEELEAAGELEVQHRDELMEAMKTLFPTMAEAIEEEERQKDRGVLHPPEVEI